MVATVAALILAITMTGTPAGANVNSGVPAVAVAQHPVPEATKKKTPKPSPSASAASAASASPSVATRRPVDEEGERWVQIALIAGGGLFGSVLVFFAIGSFMRWTSRRRSRR